MPEDAIEPRYDGDFPVDVKVMIGKGDSVDITIYTHEGSADERAYLNYLSGDEDTSGIESCLDDGVAAGATVTKTALCVGGVVEFSVHFGEEDDPCSVCQHHDGSTSYTL